MKSVKEKILSIINIISIILIVTGIIFLVSLFFTATFPYWRIMLGLVPLIAGVLIKNVIFIVSQLSNSIRGVDNSIKNIKQQINDNSSGKRKLELFENNSPKSLILFGVACLLFAIIITCLFVFVFNKFIIPNGYNNTTGVIIGRECDTNKENSWPVIEYEVDGTTYTMKGNWSNDNRAIGTGVAILYNINNPQDAMFKNAPVIVNVLAIIIDIVFGAFSVILIIIGVKKLRKEKCSNIDNYMQ